MRGIDYKIEYMVYAWFNDEGEIYFASKCRSNSDAPYKKRQFSTLQPPEDKKLIRILFKSKIESDALSYLDKLQYTVGLEEAAPDFGTLQNSIHQSPRCLRDKPHPQTTPVTVYETTGKKVGNFDSIGDAAHVLKLNKSNAVGVLNGRFWQTGGYCLVPRGKPFPKRTGPCKKRSLWTKRELIAYTSAGEVLNFDCIADAADELFKDRKNTAGIQKSLNSSKEWKSTYKGYSFFEKGSTPLFREITFATKGRPPKARSNECKQSEKAHT